MNLITDVHRPVRIGPGRRRDQHRVGEHHRAQRVRSIRRAYHGVLGRVSLDGESVRDEKIGVWVVVPLTLARMVCS